MGHSGKFVLRIPPELHRKLTSQARAQGQSLNSLCAAALGAPGSSSAWSVRLPFPVLGLLRFGSSVRGEETELSDIDLLAIVPRDVEIDRDLYDKLDKIPLADRKQSIHVAHLPLGIDDLSGFWLELALEAEVLEDSEGQIRKTLIAIRRGIASGLYRRFETHGQPYWVKQDGNEKSKAR